ncbi:MAG: hypothetical protein OHK0023_23150 [Anaerolineae bacterium]
MKTFGRIASVLIVALMLTACGGGAPSGGGISMTDAAKQFLESVYQGNKDKALEVVCAAQKTAVETQISAITLPEGTSVDLSGLKYEVASESGDTGAVKVSGTLKVTAAGTTQDVDLGASGSPFANIPMKNESGWKVCIGNP